MQRIMKAQSFTNSSLNYEQKKIMEINPTHPIIKSLVEKSKNSADNSVKDLIYLLYDTTLLSSGFTQKDPVKFSERILKLISLGLDVDSNPTEDLEQPSYDESVEDDESTMEQVD
jgi:molecular chaperone HtpG